MDSEATRHASSTFSKRVGRSSLVAEAIFVAASLLALSLSVHAGDGSIDELLIPAGAPIVINGQLGSKEWSDAGTFNIEVEPGWKVRILFKHDAEYLYFAFQGLVRGKEMRFPELLVDPLDARSAAWERGEWWLHSSFNLCEGNGEYNVYERAGVFQCAKQKVGWSANHFPLSGEGIMEIQVSFAKLGIKPTRGARFGFALDLTDTQKNWTFWPPKAQLSHPNTWGTAQLQ